MKPHVALYIWNILSCPNLEEGKGELSAFGLMVTSHDAPVTVRHEQSPAPYCNAGDAAKFLREWADAMEALVPFHKEQSPKETTNESKTK